MQRSASSITIVVFSSLSYLAIGALAAGDPALSPDGPRLVTPFTILLVALMLDSILMFLVGGRELFRILLAGQIFGLLFYQTLFGIPFQYELPLALLLLLPAAAYQPWPSNIASCAVFVVLSALFRAETLRGGAAGSIGVLAVNQGVYVMTTGAFSLVASLMTRYREEVVARQEQVEELRAVGARLAQANLSVQNYAQNVRESTLSQERKRLTREIHDIVGYLVTNVSMAFEAIRIMAGREPDQIPELTVHAREQVESGLQEMRSVLRDLRSQPVERVSGVYSIRRLVQTFAAATGIDVRVEYGNASLSYDEVVQTVIYRFVQEGMINAFRHGSATKIVIQFFQSEYDLHVTIWDNGEAPDSIDEGIGITGMRERLDLIRGSLRIELVPEGFSVSISIPRDQLGSAAATSGPSAAVAPPVEVSDAD